MKIPQVYPSIGCILGFLLLIGFTSCIETPPNIIKPTLEQQFFTEIVTQQIYIPTVSRTQSPSMLLSLTPTYTPNLPSSTPLPTLSPIQAKEAILRFLENNDECQLPCIWGITPGEMNRKATMNLFSQFGMGVNGSAPNILIVRDEAMGGVSTLELSFWEEQADQTTLYYTFNFLYHYEISGEQKIEQLILDLYVLSGANIIFDNYFDEVTHFYSLPEILTKYGKPSSVQIAAFHDTSDDYNWPIVVWVIYEKDGFMVEYSTVKERIGDQYQGCPTISAIMVTSWANRYEGAWQKALPELRFGLNRNDLVNYMKPLEQATPLTLNEFYVTFKTGDAKICLQTPIKFWPITGP